MLFLSQMARSTPAKIVRNATGVKVSRIKAFIDSDENGKFKVVRATTRANDGPRHITVRLYGKMNGVGQMKVQNKAWVHCDCPYWRYHCEVAVAARGSTSVLTSTGKYPKIRNPRMTPHLCKHLLRAVQIVGKARAKRRKVTDMPDDLELEQLVSLLDPFIPSDLPKSMRKKKSKRAKPRKRRR